MNLYNLINEELNNYLNELFDHPLKTEYDVINRRVEDWDVVTFRFKTNSETQYDIEFMETETFIYNKLNNGKKLKDYINLNHVVDDFINTVDISFTLTDRVLNDPNITNDEYTKETNKNEQLELFNRITYLIKTYINEYVTEIFVIGKDTKPSKLKIYKKLYQNIFSNDYMFFEGDNEGYNNGAYYFIKK